MRHPYARTWPQGPPGVTLHGLAKHQVQPVALHGHGDYQGRFHEREVVADALARAAPEWEVGEARAAS